MGQRFIHFQGLDIGDVDLIVCFDAQMSSIRLIQRMGRTGLQSLHANGLSAQVASGRERL